MNSNTRGIASMIPWAYVIYLATMIVMIVMFGELFSQVLNVEGRLALGSPEVLEAFSYGESGPSPATDSAMIR